MHDVKIDSFVVFCFISLSPCNTQHTSQEGNNKKVKKRKSLDELFDVMSFFPSIFLSNLPPQSIWQHHTELAAKDLMKLSG